MIDDEMVEHLGAALSVSRSQAERFADSLVSVDEKWTCTRGSHSVIGGCNSAARLFALCMMKLRANGEEQKMLEGCINRS